MKALLTCLAPLAWTYGALIRLRTWLYAKGWKSSHHPGVPVISIGNLTVGGTGKTPLAAFLLGYLQSQGRRPAYLSRGYGRNTQGYLLVQPGAAAADRYGDEAQLIATRFPEVPVAVCEDRVAGAARLIADHSIDVLVLDDAFQHLRIRRDLDIVMIDGTRPPLRDHLLPWGRLREPRSALRRAGALILGKLAPGQDPAPLLQALGRACPDAVLAHFEMRQTRVVPFWRATPTPLHEWRGQQVLAFSGLGNNAHFHTQLQQAGLHVADFLPFPDHHPYTQADCLKILTHWRSLTENNGKFGLLTTEKDYHRMLACPWLPMLQDIPLHFVELDLQPLQGWETLSRRIQAILE